MQTKELTSPDPPRPASTPAKRELPARKTDLLSGYELRLRCLESRPPAFRSTSSR